MGTMITQCVVRTHHCSIKKNVRYNRLCSCKERPTSLSLTFICCGLYQGTVFSTSQEEIVELLHKATNLLRAC